MAKLKGLGRGLDVLLGAEAPSADQPGVLPHDHLRPGRYQPRSYMDDAALETLAASIRAHGVMQPILVRPVDGGHEIIAGERRWRAAALAGLVEVPVIIREIPDRDALAMALIENIQREELNALEEAQGIARLINEFSLTHQEAADAVGRSRSAVTNLLRLLDLAASAQALLAEGRIDMGHARALLPLPGAEQARLAALIAERGLTVREAEQMARAPQTPAGRAEKAAADPQLAALSEALGRALGARVRVSAAGRRRRITIDCGSDAELSALAARLEALGAP